MTTIMLISLPNKLLLTHAMHGLISALVASTVMGILQKLFPNELRSKCKQLFLMHVGVFTF